VLPFQDVHSIQDFPLLEKVVLEFWEKNRIFEKSVSMRPENRPFVFYEGPPTANGKPGIHHVISRSIKDFVCRYKTMQGYRVDRQAGWDTHGLPVEIEIEKELGISHKEQIESYGVDRFNRKCRESVFRYVKEWNELTRRMGYWIDLENPYITYTNEYIESVWWLLSEMWKKGYVYQGFKILTYCPRCETSLSSHETSLGYQDVTEKAVTVKFPVIGEENKYILAWTTTPWTLPGNVALAAGPDIDYVEVEQEIRGKKEILVLAESRLGMLKGEHRILRKITGRDMEGWKYRPLFDFIDLADEAHPAYYVAMADFVNTEDGTGIVHTAVMYGEDDYQLGMRIGLPAKHTVDEKGRFNDLVGPWNGKPVKSAETEQEIIDYLRSKNELYREEKYTHSYPHCWRCKSPLLYYAKKSWFLKTTAVKERLIENNKRIQWFPREVGEGRFGQWLENNVDWAISRDRYWGTPLNIWICGSCKKEHAVEGMEALKRLSGVEKIEDLHKPVIDQITFPCPHCSGTMKRTSEVIDCWFDSGAMPYASVHHPFAQDGRFKKHFPADFISEGIDQTRGWFYSLLAISTIISETPAYKNCVSIELILDPQGQKMSKSLGNTVDPFKIINKEGADPLRWYLYTASPPWIPTRFDEEGIREVKRKFLGTLINTYSFFVLYANIDRFEYQDKPIPVEKRPEIDRWLLSSLNSLIARTHVHLDRYDVTKATRGIQDFVMDDLSNWYVRRNRRRFWKSEMGDDKQSAYQTLFESLSALSKIIAPFVPFLAEDMYRNLNSNGFETHESVHLASYPDPENPLYRFRDESLEERMNAARNVVSLCRTARNDAQIKVRQPLEKAVVVVPDPEDRKAVSGLEKLILEEINVRRLELAENVSGILEKHAKPLFKKLGPKFGSQVNQVGDIIKNFSDEDVQKLEKGEFIRISLDNGKHGDVTLQDVEVTTEAKRGFAVKVDGNVTVALDTRLNEDLVAEGLAREMVNRIQNMRKDAGFQVTDRIRVFYDASPALKRAVHLKDALICEEVLAAGLTEPFRGGEFNQEWEIEKEKIHLGIERIR
jgi:isoleucyl-tRNA synthetase